MLKPNTELNTDVEKLQIFDRSSGKVLEFITVYKLYIRTRMRRETVKE